jgi:hypothetical protein
MIYSRSGIHSLLAFLAGMRYDAAFFWASILPDIERKLWDSKRRRTFRGISLDLDDAPSHNAKGSRQESARTKANMVAHPADSPDGAPSDFFFLFA